MKKTNLLLSVFISLLQISIAQTKLLTMDDAIIKQKTTLAPAKLKQLTWVKGTNNYSFVDKKNDVEVLIIGAADNNKQETVATLTEINDAMVKANLKTLDALPAIQWKSDKDFTFEAEQKLLSYNLKSKNISVEGDRDFGKDATGKDVAPVTNYIAYDVKNNLYVYDGRTKSAVTSDEDENVVNGQSVHRDEFGISKGTFWSPKGGLLAFYRMDQRMVTDYPIVDWTVRPAKVTEIKYPMAGDKSHEVNIGIYKVSNQTTIFLKTGEPKEQYLTNIAWSPDELHIYVAILNREQNYMKLNCYNASTGDLEKKLFEEKNEKYVHPMHPLMFVPNHPDQFIWQSERDGYNHIYFYQTNGMLIKQLTSGNWVVTDIAGFDEKGEKLFYSSTAESPVTRNLYCIDLKTGTISKITSGDGTHTTTMNDSKTFVIDNFQSTTIPREQAIYSVDGKKSQTLKIADNPMKDYKLGKLSIFKLKSDGGDDLYCRMIKPIDFDSTKKYPAIVYLYNGPGVQLINNAWNGAGDFWLQYMAERGFVVFTIDGRGSNNRGLAFEQASFRHLGVAEMKDQMVGANYLKSLKYVDASRMGIMGWSFGGFMTTSIMTTYPDVFKVAVAGGPVIDWSYYEVMYTERYMDTPQENPEGYKETSVLNRVDNLKGKLMLIHGTQDPVVVWQHSLMFLKIAVDKGKQVDYFVYPGHEHNVIGKDRVHLFDKISEYFISNL